MAILVLPACFALRGEMTWERPNAVKALGQTIDGEVLERTTAAGGRWRASLRGLVLSSADLKRTWEALLERWELGEATIVVPRQTFHIRPAFAGPMATTSWSDGTTFDDDTLFSDGEGFGELAVDIALRATSLQVRLPPGGSLSGGESFSLTGGGWGTRLYRVAAVTDIDADPVNGDLVTITFGPPARETYSAGIDVDFERPRCTMRAMLGSEGAAPTYTRSRFASASMVFWEAPALAAIT